MDNDDENFGIYRAEATKTSGAGWRVFLQRQGQRISKAFQDSIYGSSEASLAQARAYRDEVIATVPAWTSHEQAVRPRKNNKSGVPGVRYAEYGKGPFWMAMIETRDGRKSKHFSVAKYGYDQAKSLAIAQREAWLQKRPSTHSAATGIIQTDEQQRLTGRYDLTSGTVSGEYLPEAEVKALLASIDARFDALRPPRLIVRVRCYQMSDLAVYVSDAGRPARNKQIYVGMRRQSLEIALMKASPKIAAAITEFYNAATAKWFMTEYGERLLDPADFDPNTGFSVRLFVPADLANDDPAE